jgi:hypothetical protein
MRELRKAQSPDSTAGGAERFRSGIVPRAIVRPDALELRFLCPRTEDPAELALVEQAFECWREVWSEAFYELEGATVLFSDNFSRQDEIAAFFQDGECLGLMCHRIVDFAQPLFREDSYFEAWPKETLDRACAQGTKIFISNHFTLARAWRKADGVSMKELIMAMSIERFMQSDADCWVGTCRHSGGVHTLCYRLGCEQLAADVPYHNVRSDLVAIYRSTMDRQPGLPATEAVLAALLPRSRPSTPLTIASGTRKAS